MVLGQLNDHMQKGEVRLPYTQKSCKGMKKKQIKTFQLFS